MTREFKVGDRVVGTDDALHHRRGAPGVVTEVLNNGWLVDWENFPTENHYVMHGELTHAEPVPIGYTGKLRDMDLQEGDVVRSEVSKNTYTIAKDFNDELATGYWGVTVHFSNHTYTLISRANRAQATPQDQWSDWQLSRKDGTMSQQYAEVQTVTLDGTDQVVYRGRGEPVRREVMTVSVAIVDGQPYWDTVEEVVL